MNTQQIPHVEVIQSSSASVAIGPNRWRRAKVFLSIFLVALAVGLAFVYSRSPVFRATTSVLTVKPKAVDMESAAADMEHVAIQQRLLLGEELISRLVDRANDDAANYHVSIDELRGMLDVAPVSETNLLELRAEGGEPAQLQDLVNWWGESYQQLRLDEIETATKRTTKELEDQKNQLAQKIEATRAELLAFRESHDIVSLERDENRSLAGLKGLNDALNKAREKLVETRAEKTATEEAIAKGESVIPREQRAEIAKLKLDVERARGELADVENKYTQRYMERDPDLEGLPELVRLLERDLQQALEIARRTVRDEGQQAFDTARIAVAALEQKLAHHQNNVQQFTEHFKEFEVIEERLTRLETAFADNEERISLIDIGNQQKFPPIKVVEWARMPTKPIHPNYQRDVIIAVVSALGFALFFTWLFEYLTERSREVPAVPNFGVRIYPSDPLTALNSPAGPGHLVEHQVAPNRLEHSQQAEAMAALAESPILPRELAPAELKALMTAAEPVAASYASLLLSGVAPGELALLHKGCFDRAGSQIHVPGPNARDLDLGESVWPAVNDVIASMSPAQLTVDTDRLDFQYVTAAREARLTEPVGVHALAIWHSYVSYLIRQGINDAALHARVGPIEPNVLDQLKLSAPPGAPRATETVNFTHPALA